MAPASRTITVDVTDEDGTFLVAGTKTITVNNVAPTIALSGNATVNEGALYSLTLGAVTDPGTDTVTSYTIHWGDGANTGPVSGNPTGQVVTHTYVNGPTSPTITVDLVDEDGTFLAAGTKTITVTNVAAYAVGLKRPDDRQLRRHQALHVLDHRSRHTRYVQRRHQQWRHAGHALQPHDRQHHPHRRLRRHLQRRLGQHHLEPASSRIRMAT